MKNLKFFCLILLLVIFLFSCKKDKNEQSNVIKDVEEESLVVVDQVDLKDQDSKILDFSPLKPEDGGKFTIAIVRSGEFYMYVDALRYIIEAMEQFGWLNKINFNESDFDNIPSLLSKLETIENYSEYIQFPKEYYYDFDWNRSNENSSQFKKIMNSEAIDLVISFGTVSSQAISSMKDLTTPVLVTAVSDPVSAGIIESVYDSGKDNITAFCDPDRFARQIRLFHNIVGFKKLGILYNDTPTGKTYAAYDTLIEIGNEKDFEVIGNTNVIEEDSNPNAPAQYLKALQELAPKIDALYLTIQAGITLDNMPEIIKIVNKYKLPTFAMEGSEFVKRGALFSISAYEIRGMGIFNAKNIVRILKGANPRELDMIFSITPAIAVNLKASEIIGFDIPIDILGSADEVYNEIQ